LIKWSLHKSAFDYICYNED